jgi:hypothetical protein
MRWTSLPLTAILAMVTVPLYGAVLHALIVDGRNNHDWRRTTPVIHSALESSGVFQVDVATAPPDNESMASFHPEFSRYAVVVLNYTDLKDGGAWPEAIQLALERYMTGGGGLVAIHAASSAFPSWKEYNRMTGLGGWGGRDERWGPHLLYRDGAVVRETKPGRAGHHGQQHSFQVTVRKADHPIMAGLPPVWMHARDELFDCLRGPAERLTVLATAYSDSKFGGTGEHEPVLFVVNRGRGRVFHTALGHSVESMSCAGFILTLQRGAQWAATGRVTIPVPDDFPTEKEVRTRP